MKIGLSIIIPSYYRPELLDFGLKSLTLQRFPLPYEIIVLNDGGVDETEAICNKYKGILNIKYVFTGQRNSITPKWGSPGVVFNEGVKIAEGKYIILSSPEMYHLDTRNLRFLIAPLVTNPKVLTMPYGKYDKNSLYLDYLKSNKSFKPSLDIYEKLENPLDTKMPFCMGMKKEQFIAIGGYDPIYFKGFCFDDNDFIDRLLEDGCKHFQTEAQVIHLFHSRKQEDRIGLASRNILWKRNQRLYLNRKNRKPPKLALDLSVGTPLQGDKTVNKEIIPLPNVNKLITPAIPIENKELSTLISVPIRNMSLLPEVQLVTNNTTEWYLKKIPKIAHFYWGNEKLPYLRYLTVYSFHKYNPDWEIRVYYPKIKQTNIPWTTKEQKYDSNVKEDYYPALKTLPVTLIEMDFSILGLRNDYPEVHKSDFLRWYLLANIGGLWSDMDVIYFDSMNNININKRNNKDGDTVVCCRQPKDFSIGFMLSSFNNDFYRAIWEKSLTGVYCKSDYQSVGVILLNSLMKDIPTARSLFPKLKILALDFKTIYSYNASMIQTIYNTTNLEYITEEAIALHWYAGHPLAATLINEVTHKNYSKYNNVVCKVAEISMLNKKESIIAINRAMGEKWIPVKVRKPLTIHTVCKDEPFIYYAVKSVYDYADKILLYDTGTTDKIALKGIERLLKEDKEKKIIFKLYAIDKNEQSVVISDKATFPNAKFGVGQIRQIMIDDTDTEYFMTVDGDEIFYKETMERIINEIIPNAPEDKYQFGLPHIWFYDIRKLCKFGGTISGRLLKTNKVKMTGSYPEEYHASRETGEVFTLDHKNFLTIPDLMPFCHYNLVIKPKKYEKYGKSEIREYTEKLPEIMEEVPYFINELLKRRKSNEQSK